MTLYGQACRRTATAFFTVAGHTPQQAAARLAERKINVWDGHNYAWEVTRVLGIRDSGSAVRTKNGVLHLPGFCLELVLAARSGGGR